MLILVVGWKYTPDAPTNFHTFTHGACEFNGAYQEPENSHSIALTFPIHLDRTYLCALMFIKSSLEKQERISTRRPPYSSADCSEILNGILYFG